MERCVRAFGLYRSGTTWLQALIDANLQGVLPLPAGCTAYKHSMFDIQMHRIPADAFIALTYKTLLKWCDSMCRNSFDLIDEFDLAYRKGDTPIEIAYRLENHPNDKPVQIGVSLERLIRLYHDHWDFWHRQPRDKLFVSHRRMAKRPDLGMIELARASMMQLTEWHQNVLTVANSKPFVYTDDDYVEFLTPTHIDVIRRLQRPEIQEFLLRD